MSDDLSGLPELPLDEWERTKETLHLYLQIVASNGLGGSFALIDGLSVAEFYEQLRRFLGETGIVMSIQDRVFDVPGISGPFSTLTDRSTGR